MAKVLVIPDVHLKPWMFDCVPKVEVDYDQIVVLGDLVDDWGRGNDMAVYAETIGAAARFAEDNPDSLWCYGNHDYCYLHFDEGIYNSGFSDSLKYLVRNELLGLKRALGDRLQVVHKIGDVYFSHGGISERYLRNLRHRLGEGSSLEECIEFTNEVASSSVLWKNESPLWFRPHSGSEELGPASGLVQVVGHTPVSEPTWVDDVLMVDTFSTYQDGAFIGNQALIVFDTESLEYRDAKTRVS